MKISGFHTSSWLALVFVSFVLFSINMIVQVAFGDTVASTIPVGSKPWGVGVNPNTNMIYVANSDCCATNPTVSVINGTTNTVVSTLSSTNYPKGITANQNTNKIYVAIGMYGINANSSLSIINGSNNSFTNNNVPNSPNFVTVNQNTNRIYVTEYSG